MKNQTKIVASGLAVLAGMQLFYWVLVPPTVQAGPDEPWLFLLLSLVTAGLVSLAVWAQQHQ